MRSLLRRLFPPRRDSRRTARLAVEQLDDRINPYISFGGVQEFALGGYATGPVIADFNGDGKNDLATADYHAQEILVQLSTTAAGASSATLGSPARFGTALYPGFLEVGDFNGDGRADILADTQNPAKATVLLNTTAAGATVASFAPRQEFGFGSVWFGKVADFNGDGRDDIAYADLTNSKLTVLLNATPAGASTATFTASTFSSGIGVGALSVADVDGDGRPDLTVPNYYDNVVSVFLNTAPAGSATTSFSAPITVACPSPETLASGDVNADGRADLVVTSHPVWPTESFSASVLLNTSAAGVVSFSAPQPFHAGEQFSSLRVIDLDGDESPEVTALRYSQTGSWGSQLLVFRNTTGGGASTVGFEPADDFLTAPNANGVTFGDFNQDGRPDAAFTHLMSHGLGPVAGATTVSVALNQSTRTFRAPRAFPTGVGATAVAVADFNADGRADAVTANHDDGTGNTVSVLRNSTPTFFTTLVNLTTTSSPVVGSAPVDVAVGDFDGDGRPDPITVNFLGNSVSVLRNTSLPNAALTFAPQQTFAAGSGPIAVAVGDFNGDGRADIATANQTAGTVSVLLNTTPLGASVLSFAAQQVFAAGLAPTDIAVADFDGDGRPDIAVTNPSQATVSVLRNLTPVGATAATFAARLAVAAGSGSTGLAAGDLNRDGRPDLVMSTTGSGVVVLRNTAAGGLSFAPVQSVPVGGGSGAVVMGDFDGDGRLDFAVTSSGSPAVVVVSNRTRRGSATLAFSPAQSFDLGSLALGLAVGDLNGDGRPDLITTNTDGNSGAVASVLANTAHGEIVIAPPALVAQLAGGDVWGLAWQDGDLRQSLLVRGTATALAANRAGDYVGAFPGAGVLAFRPSDPNLRWGFLSTVDPVAVGIDALGNVYASFAGYGTYEYELATDSWVLLTPSVANKLAVTANGDVIANFAGFGVYRYRIATNWVRLNTPDATVLAVGENGDIAANFGGHGVYRFKAGTWSLLNGNPAVALAVAANGSVVASFGTHGVAKYIPYARGWQQLHTGTPVPSVAMDLYGNVFASLGGFGVYEFSQYQGWRLRGPFVATLLAHM